MILLHGNELMVRTVYPSIEEVTRPETLSALVNQPITTSRLVPFQTTGWPSSESQFLAVEADGVEHPRFVLKRMVPDRDWVMQKQADLMWWSEQARAGARRLTA